MTVFNRSAVSRFFDAIRTRRVDMIDLADSNSLFGGHGRNHGLGYAIEALGLPVYRTMVSSAAENRNVSASLGYKQSHIADGSRLNRYSEAPAELDMLMPDCGSNDAPASGQWAPPHNYWYMRAGDTYTNGNNGINVDANHPINVNANLKGWFTYGELKEAGTGAINPAIRRGDSPFTELVSLGAFNPAGKAANAAKRVSITLAAATRNYPLQVRWHTSNNQIVGPMIQFYHALENTDRPAGICLHTLLGRGGQGYWHYLTALRRSKAATKFFLDEATFLQNVSMQERMVMVSLNSGLNDGNISNASIGPNPQPSSATAAGFADNLEGLIIYFRECWAEMGGRLENLFFCLFDSTPISNPDGATLISYRTESRKLALKYPNTCEVDLTFEQPTIETNAAAWYNSGGSDRNHMTQTGYEQVMLLAMTRLVNGNDSFQEAAGPMPSPKSLAFKAWLERLMAERRKQTTPARATNYYFSTTGNDTSGDGSIGNPWQTVAKAITTLAASNGNIGFFFKRGDQWNETTLPTLNKPNVTIGAWGTGSNKPWFNRFTLKYNATGWTLAAGNRYTRTEATNVCWVRYQDYILSKSTGSVLRRVTSSTDCENTSNSFFWGTSTLHINLGGTNPNTLNLEACPTNTANGIDVTATGCRIENIRVDGWGMDAANPHNPQSYQIRWGIDRGMVGSAYQCETFYGGTHLHAIYNAAVSAFGGAVLIEECEAGFALQGVAGETIFNTYTTLGGQETICNKCKVVAGTLWNGTAAWARRAMAFYGHTAGTGKIGLAMWVDGEITESAVGPSAGASFADLPPAASLSEVRGFIIGETIVGGAVPWFPYRDMCYINCFYDITPIDTPSGGYSSSGASSQTWDGWAINVTWRVNQVNQASTTRRALFNALGTNNLVRLWHCRFHIIQSDNNFGIDYDANGADTSAAAELRNCIYTSQVGDTGTVTVALNNDPDKCFNNAYRNISGGAGVVNRFDYGNHGFKVELTADLDIDDTALSSGHQCARAGSPLVGVEYDRFWRARNLSSPSIGPVEAI